MPSILAQTIDRPCPVRPQRTWFGPSRTEARRFPPTVEPLWAFALHVVEVGQLLQRVVALVDLLHGQPLQATRAEVLDTEGAHDAAEDHRAAQRRIVGGLSFRQVAEEAAGEAVAGAGRVGLVFKWVGGRREDAF